MGKVARRGRRSPASEIERDETRSRINLEKAEQAEQLARAEAARNQRVEDPEADRDCGGNARSPAEGSDSQWRPTATSSKP